MGNRVLLLTVRSPIELELVEVPAPVVIPEPGPPPGDVPPIEPGPPLDEDPIWVGVPENVRIAIMREFARVVWPCAVRIGFCESGFRTGAINPGPGEFSVGIWQINLQAHPNVSEAEARDVDFSTAYAARLRYARGDWSDWANCAKRVGCPQGVV